MNKTQYIVRMLLLALIYVCIFFYAAVFTNQVGWILLIFATVLGLIECFSFLASPKKIYFTNTEKKVLHVGEMTQVHIYMKKSAILPIYFTELQLRFLDNKHALVFAHYFGWEQEITIQWQPQTRGVIERQRIAVTTQDFLQLFKKAYIHGFNVDWLVLPAPHPLTGMELSFLETMMQKQVFGENSYTIKKFREYQAGDSLKQIDWKISSKLDELVFREYDLYEPIQWKFIFYGVESEYFEQTLSLFYTLYQRYQDDVTYILVGTDVAPTPVVAIEAFARVLPLKKLVDIPLTRNERGLVFVPESTAELAKILGDVSLDQQQVFNYQQLLGGGEK